MLKKCCLMLFVLCAFAPAYAQDGKKIGWELNLKKASLDATSTDVKNAAKYKDFPEAKLTADSETMLKGRLDLDGNYFGNNYVWGNNVLLEYGKTTLKPYDGVRTTNENSDNIQFTTSYTQRLWHVQNALGGFEAGPYGSLAYQTEFNSVEGSPLKKVLRGALGAKVFEGKYIKSLYAAGFAERDFTYDPAASKFGWEAGFEINQPVREGVKAVYSGLFRNYLYESRKQSTDLDYELELDARLEVQLFSHCSLAPFVKYYTAQARAFGTRGQNLQLGISFAFSHLFVSADK